MTEQPDQAQAPAPGAAPVPAFPFHSPDPESSQEATVPPPAASPDQSSGRAAELERELAGIRAAAVRGAKSVMRVLAPHTEFRHGGITVRADPTQVPAHAVAPLMTAAAEAGVTIEEVS